MASTTQQDRIRKELLAAGITSHGLRKGEVQVLPDILHADEHIGGVVYGRYTNGLGMLVATNRRVIFLDKRLLFTSNEEVTYDVVSGIKMSTAGLVSSLVLHTRVKDFTLRYVNQKCANMFKKYIETRRLEGPAAETTTELPKLSLPFLTPEAITFLQSQEIAVLSSADKAGVVYGAVVYYVTDEQHRIYSLTKADTTKARNIIAHNRVALTIFDAVNDQTLQLQGTAKIETDEKIKRHIFDQIMKPHKYSRGYKLPPVAWIDAGMFVIVTVTPTSGNYSDFSKKST